MTRTMLSARGRRRNTTRTRRRLAAPVAALMAGTLLAVVPATPAVAAEGVLLTKEAPEQVMLGEPATITLTARNTGDEPEYNLSFRDVLATGVTYRPGSSAPAGVGEPQVLTRTDGRQVLVWANVSDLPVGAEQELRFEVVPGVAPHPVADEFRNTADVYLSADPRTVPKFDGQGAYTSGATVQDASNETVTDITAIEVEKEEPSPEHELVRGVHDHDTTYTLTVTNNDHHASNAVVLVDYLPAQLEFLGCGTVDNTPDGGVEYPTAPRLDVSTTDVAGCVAPSSVRTVAGDPDAPSADVHTRVQWDLGTFAPGETREIVYAAGIPQRANELAFPSGEPTPESLEQTANLDNNTGASTRETTGEQPLLNRAIVSATYTGPVAAGGSTQVQDVDELVVTSEDLAVQKSVTPDTFAHGGIATYTLELQTGEYADATDIVLTDVIPDGLCPLGGAGDNFASSAPPECDGSAGDAPSQDFASVTEGADGRFTVVFTPFDLDASGTATVTYRARMLATYRDAGTAPTVVGDAYRNVVELTGITTTLAEVDAPGGVSTETVHDDSEAWLHSEEVQLDKRILPNTTTSSYACTDDAADYRDAASLTAQQVTFGKGSLVCFLLRVEFPAGNETKNAVLTDFLPDHLAYVPGSAQELSANEVTAVLDEANLTFTLGDPVGGDRFVPRGQTFLYRLAGEVVRSAGGTTPDVPGNLAKLRWTNTDGVVGFLRDREDFRVPPAPRATVEKTADRQVATAPGTTGPLADGGDVRIGDVVDYTVEVGNAEPADGTPQRDVIGPDVWDRLPAGITCADVSAISNGGACLDPGQFDPADPADPAYAGDDTRSIIRWKLPPTTVLTPGQTLDLTYTVTYPDTISATRSYRNDVDIASYTARTNQNNVYVTHHPADNVDERTDPSDEDAPRAHDDHTVRTPVVTITKGNTADQVDDAVQGAGADHYATIGEQVTYVVETTLPAETSVYEGVLADPLPSGFRFDGVTYEHRSAPSGAWGPLPAGWTGSTTQARVTLPARVEVDDTPDAIRMTITATVTEHTANVHGQLRTNTARFTSDDENGATIPPRQASSDVRVVEPNPAPLKVVDDDTPVAGQVLAFTVTARNLLPAAPGQMLPPLHDARLVDCVPAGLAVVTGSETTATGTVTVGVLGTEGCAADRTPVVWEVGQLDWRDGAGTPWPTMTYDVEVDPAAAGAADYVNTASLSGFSLPAGNADRKDYDATVDESVRVPAAGLTKSVTPARVTIGDEAEYTLEVTLPQDVNFYDAAVVDELPAGIDPASVELTSSVCTYDDDTTCSPAVTATAIGPDGALHGWSLGDIASDPATRTLTLTYTAVVTDVATNVAGTTLTNTAHLAWNLTDRVATPDVTDTFDSSTPDDTAVVTVVEPDLSIDKTVSDATPLPGETFTYTVRVTNATGANVSTAHDVDVEDVVPAGVRVLAGTVSDGGVPAGGSPGGGTVGWTGLGPIAPGASIELTYDARLVSPAPATAQVNTATVESYTSLPTGGREYDGPSDTATVTAGLPEVTVDKTVLDGPPAYVDQPVRWQVVVTNTGEATAHDVDVVDTLPAEWSYVTDSSTVAVAGAPAVGREPTVSGDPEVLTWDDLGDLEPGESLTIVLSAEPGAGVVPGLVGSGVAHVNNAEATALDLEGTDGGQVVTTDDDDAQTRIDAVDLTIAKTGVGTPVAGAAYSWTVTVTNNGPDTAAGPFTVTDTLPADVSGATASGPGWTCGAPAGGEIACQRTAAGDTLADDASFPPITVTATVDTDVTAGTDLVNAAEVAGGTLETDETNNDDDTTDEVTVRSDLGIEKSMTGALVPGGSATYRIEVENHGPSPAYGEVEVVDTLPAGTTYDSFTGTGWTLDRSGQTLTFTWTGATPVPLGAMTPIVVEVEVDSALTGAITNTASVTEPTDPTTGPEEQDSDSVTSTPVPSADLGIAKSSPGDFEAGEQGVYEFTVTDFGPSDAAGPIRVTDTLPDELTYVSVDSDDGWTCSATGQDLTCTLAGGIADGDSSTFEVTVDIDEALTGDVLNTATVDGATADPNPGNDSDDDNTGIEVNADLSIAKTLVTSPVVAGEDVTYQLVARNDGPATSPGPITVTDALPAGLTFVSATGTGWACSAAAGLVTCERAGTLASGTDAPTITLVATVGSGVGTTTLTNTANVAGPATDPTPGNNTDHEPTPVTEETEIAVTKTVTGADPVAAGATTSYSVVVSNTGSSDARGVTVTDVLPAGMSLVSASGDGWTCAGGVCTRDRVVAGQSAPVLTIVARVASGTPSGASLTNTVTVSTVTDGDTAAGNTDDATVGVYTAADLALTKTHAGSAVAGQATSFELTVRNDGPSDAAGPITVVDTLPAGLTYLSASAPWTCAPAAADPRQVRCTVPSGLGAGGTLPVLSLQVMVAASAETGPVTNTATVSSPTGDPVPGNNTDTADVTVDRLADVSVVKTHTGPVRIGATVEFTLAVTNEGPSEARDVVVTDTLPVGLDFVSATGDGWTCSREAAVISCALSAPLAPGGTAAPVSVVVGVTPMAYPGVVNLAEVSTSTTDPDPTDDLDTDELEVPALVDLQLEKSLRGKLVVGEQATYLLKVTNDGPTDAPGPVTVTDTLPRGLDLVSATGPGWACEDAGRTVTCERAAGLRAGAGSTVRVVVDVLPSAYPSVVNTATVSSPAEETDEPGGDDNTGTHEGPVRAVSELTIEKEVVRSTAQAVTYRITVTNQGPSPTVRPVTVRDPMPDGLRLLDVRGEGWSCTSSPQGASCVHADQIPVDATRSLTLRTKVTAEPGTTIVNVATASGVGTAVSDSVDVEAGVLGGGDGGDDGDGEDVGGNGLIPDTGGPALVLLPLGLLLALAGAVLLVRRRRS